MNNEHIFLEEILSTIQKKDSLHFKKVKNNLSLLIKSYPVDFNKFLKLIHQYCLVRGLSSEKVAGDYLKMINDMRVEGIYFKKHREYSCKSQQQAY